MASSSGPSKTTRRDWRNAVIGAIGLALVLVWAGGLLILPYEKWQSSILFGMAGRIGFVMVALWAALPALRPLFRDRSTVLGFLVTGLLLVAVLARIKIFPLVMTLLCVVFVLNGTLRWLSNLTDG